MRSTTLIQWPWRCTMHPSGYLSCFHGVCLSFSRQTIKKSFILIFYIQFFKQHVNIIFLTCFSFCYKEKIALIGDACSKPVIITIKFHNLHPGDIRGPWVKLPPTMRRSNFLPLPLVRAACVSFGLSLASPFCLLFDGSSHQFFLDFCVLFFRC